VTNYIEASPANLPKATVSRLAEDIAAKLEFGAGKDVAAIADRLGGAVTVHDLFDEGMEQSGTLFVDAPNNFKIHVPFHTSPVRDRFTIAHELGHYFIHYLWKRANGEHIEKLCAKRFGGERVEWEANWFAAAFLMPSQDFRDSYKKYSGKLNVVARHFDVSTDAARIRAGNLGLLS
jgi:predicted transcriptional regulator